MTGWWTLGGAGLGLLMGYGARVLRERMRVGDLERQAREHLKSAEREAEVLKREAEVGLKAELLRMREEGERATDARRKDLQQLEERLVLRESTLERRAGLVENKEAALELAQTALRAKQAELDGSIAEARQSLERIAGLSAEEAREALLKRVERDARVEMAGLLRRLQQEVRETADREAEKVVTIAIQRFAGSHASEAMTSSVTLPNAEMKGRVIGREGRNIRSLETCTGVTVLIDDTPDSVLLSSFDPVRREVARQALELLVADGRIHPSRIEEVVADVQLQMEATIEKAGVEALFELGIQPVSPDLARMLGRLRFRTSYTQNVLRHSVEVARLMGLMAGELGLDLDIAKRVGLFHDIGKALDHQLEGGHAVIGGEFLKRCGESPDVVNGVAAHHHDVEAINVYAALVAAADAISGARPGARSETTEIYIKRLEGLEQIANSFAGVKKSYAIHAGREVRVFVEPSRVDENEAMVMARNISKQIEDELKYPGQIRVVVIRETRCVEYAR